MWCNSSLRTSSLKNLILGKDCLLSRLFTSLLTYGESCLGFLFLPLSRDNLSEQWDSQLQESKGGHLAANFLPTAGSSPVLFCFTLRGVEVWHFESLEVLRWKSQHRSPCALLSSLIPSSTQPSSAPEAFQVPHQTSSSLPRGLLCQICLEHGIPWRMNDSGTQAKMIGNSVFSGSVLT